MADDNSDSAKTSFCKSITAMKILHTPRKILFAKNLSLQHTSLPHRIFGKLPFLLEILLNIQTQSLNFEKKQASHHSPSGTYVSMPEPGIAIQQPAWTDNFSFIQRAGNTPVRVLPHCTSCSRGLNLHPLGLHCDFTLRVQINVWRVVNSAVYSIQYSTDCKGLQQSILDSSGINR